MATTKPHTAHGDFSERMRKLQGEYLARLRIAAGLTQAEVAKALGHAWPAVVGSFEQGRANLPPEDYLTYATLVGEDPKVFVQTILRWHNPWAWSILWGGSAPPRAKDAPQLEGRKDVKGLPTAKRGAWKRGAR